VSRYAATGKKVTVNCTCACGHQFRCRLEKRKQYRKGSDLPGKFTLLGEDGSRDSGLVKVVDLSTTGVKLKMTVPRVFPIGANLLIEFRLDDRKRTPMEKRVIVRNVSGLYVGASFHPNEMDDPRPRILPDAMIDFVRMPACRFSFLPTLISIRALPVKL
jgi:hypothetical protein